MDFVIIVGHSERSQGMTLFTGEKEWAFNKRVGEYAFDIAADRGLSLSVLHRSSYGNFADQIRRVSRLAADLQPKLVIELHLNALDGMAHTLGSEALALDISPSSQVWGRYLCERLTERFGILPRGSDGVKVLTAGQRGYQNLKLLKSTMVAKKIIDVNGQQTCLDPPAVILEPCFADTEHKDSRSIVTDPQGYATLLVECFEDYLRLL